MTFYNEQQLKDIEKRQKGTVFSLIAAALIAVGVGVGLVLAVNEGNERALRVVTTAVWLAAGWYVIGCLCAVVVPCGRRKEFLRRLLRAEKKDVTGKVVQIGRTYTVRRIPMREIRVSCDGKEVAVYLEEDVPLPFAPGAVVSLRTVDRVVFSCEVSDA